MSYTSGATRMPDPQTRRAAPRVASSPRGTRPSRRIRGRGTSRCWSTCRSLSGWRPQHFCHWRSPAFFSPTFFDRESARPGRRQSPSLTGGGHQEFNSMIQGSSMQKKILRGLLVYSQLTWGHSLSSRQSSGPKQRSLREKPVAYRRGRVISHAVELEHPASIAKLLQ